MLQVPGIPDADLVCFVRKNGGKTWRAERHPSPLGTNERNRIGHRCNVIASVYVIWSYAYRVLVPVCHTPSIDELPGRPTVILSYGGRSCIVGSSRCSSSPESGVRVQVLRVIDTSDSASIHETRKSEHGKLLLI